MRAFSAKLPSNNTNGNGASAAKGNSAKALTDKLVKTLLQTTQCISNEK